MLLLAIDNIYRRPPRLFPPLLRFWFPEKLDEFRLLTDGVRLFTDEFRLVADGFRPNAAEFPLRALLPDRVVFGLEKLF